MDTPMPRISAPHHRHVRTAIHLDGAEAFESVHVLSIIGDRTVCGTVVDKHMRAVPAGGLTCPRCVAELEAGTDRLLAEVAS